MSTHDIQIVTTSRPLFPPPITPDELKDSYVTYVNRRPPTAFVIYKAAY
ncbi:6427_t:CDS:1, partial [Racocetra fulgida]